MTDRLFTFVGGQQGPWQVAAVRTIAGDPLPAVSRLSVVAGEPPAVAAGWRLRGITSNERYVTRHEKNALAAIQQPLGRYDATCAAFIPIRKSAEWWALTQDERRTIFEATSRHIQIGMEYLPAVARRLHHCRDLGAAEPFDFLTWFEFAPDETRAFDDLVGRLRETDEWRFVEREVDIRLVRDAV